MYSRSLSNVNLTIGLSCFTREKFAYTQSRILHAASSMNKRLYLSLLMVLQQLQGCGCRDKFQSCIPAFASRY